MSDQTHRINYNRDIPSYERNKPKEREKPQESDFDRLLRQKGQQPQSQTPATKFSVEQATEHAAKEQKKEHHEPEKKQREKREEEHGSERSSQSRSEHGRVHDQRVEAKGRPGERQSGGQQSSQHHGEGGGHGSGRRELQQMSRRDVPRHMPIALSGRFEEQLKAKLAVSGADPRMTQALLNKVVQSVRLGFNEKREREIVIELHEKAFRGLSFKVTSRGGKVHVHFLATNAETRRVFENSRDAIRDALKKQGLNVDDVVVSG